MFRHRRSRYLRTAALAVATIVLTCTSAIVPMAATSAAPTINLSWMGWDPASGYNATIASIEAAHPNYHVTYTQIPYAEFDARVHAMLVAGTAPDILELEEYNIPIFGAKGVLAPMDSLLQSSGMENDVLPSMIFRANGKVWGVAVGAATMVLYYNPTLFKKAGLAPPSADPTHPWSWAQFLAAAKKLTVDQSGKHPGDAGFDPSHISVYGTNEETSWHVTVPLVRTSGAGFFNKQGTKFTLGQGAGPEVIQAVADLSLVDHVAPNPTFAASLPSADAMLANGQVAMDMSGSWVLPTFASAHFVPGIAALPSFGHPQNIVWGAGYVITKDSQHPAEAWETIRDFLEAPTLYQLGQQNPPFKSWYTDPAKIALWANTPVHPASFKQVVFGTLTNPAIGVQGENVWVKNFGQMMDNYVTPGLDPVWLGHQSASSAIAGISRLVAPLVSGGWK